MASSGEILDRWFAQTLEMYPREQAAFMASGKDRFRNPAGYALRTAMAVIVEELLGNMNAGKVAQSLAAIMRLRVLQGWEPGEAVAFIALLGPLLGDASRTLEARMEQLGRMAADQYQKCSDHLEFVRAREAERMRAVHRRPSELR